MSILNITNLTNEPEQYMKKLIKKLYIILGNYKYQIEFLTSGKMYITRVLTHKGFKKFMDGKIKLGSGILY